MIVALGRFYAEVSNFDHAEEENGIDQTRDEQSDDVFVMSGIDAALNEIPFAEEASGWRNANEGERSYEKTDKRQGHLLELPIHCREVSLAGFGEKDSSEKEYAERHEGVGYDMVDRADHTRFVS